MSKTATVKLKTEGVKELTTELNAAAKAADKLEDSLEETADAADDVGEASTQMSGGLDRMSCDYVQRSCKRC
jgi:methyl-accepting chemotaxis protein